MSNTAAVELLTGPQGTQGTPGLSGNITGEIRHYGGFRPPTGWLKCDGSAYSRTTYATLFATISISTTGNTHGTTTVDSIPSTAGMDVGMPVSGANIPASTTIASIVSETSITLSQSASGTTTGGALVVAPFGVGDGSTTFNVPDLRSQVVLGASTQYLLTGTTFNGLATITGLSSTQDLAVGMTVTGSGTTGTTIASVDSSSQVTCAANFGGGAGTNTYTFTPTISGSRANRVQGTSGGEETHTLTTAELAVHSHANTASSSTPTITVTNPVHQHTMSNCTGASASGGNFTCNAAGACAVNTGNGTTSQVAQGSTATSSTPAITVNNVNAGSGSSHNNMQPWSAVHYIIKT